MRAAVCDRFGGPVEMAEMPAPRPGRGEVLIDMRASSLNAWDHDLHAGTVMGRIGNLRRPQHRVLGADLAGIVAEVGPDVTRLKVGDEVFGDCSSSHWGGLADQAVAPEKLLAVKSPDLSFAQAAALPQAGLLALQGLRRKGLVKPGDRVLVNGGGGGMGHFAIQLARHFGAEVTGVDRADKLDFMRAIGAAHVIDFAATDFTATGRTYDLIIDPVANRPLRNYARTLTPRGRFVVVGGTVRTLIGVLTLGSLMSRRGRKRYGIVPLSASLADLEELQRLTVAGSIGPIIDRIYPLEQAQAALERFRAGDICGKVVVGIADQGEQ